jgi:FkbM family methyltransferase
VAAGDVVTAAVRTAFVFREHPLLRSASRWLYRLLDRSALATILYVSLWQSLLRRLHGSYRDRMLETLLRFEWRLPRLPPTTIQLAGAKQAQRVAPHPGMADFQASFYRRFVYEPEVVSFLEQHLEQVDNVLEIGANVGLYTVFCARRLAPRGGRVFAFEPGDRAFRALLDNVAANHADNVVAFKAALYDHHGIATFYEPLMTEQGYRDAVRASLVEKHARWQATVMREYPVLTISPDVLESVFKISGRLLIKMDIEGAERLVLQALEPLLIRYRPKIVMEALFNECGELNQLEFIPRIYRLFHLTDQGPIEQPRFVGDPAYQFKDYFLSPRPAADS